MKKTILAMTALMAFAGTAQATVTPTPLPGCVSSGNTPPKCDDTVGNTTGGTVGNTTGGTVGNTTGGQGGTGHGGVGGDATGGQANGGVATTTGGTAYGGVGGTVGNTTGGTANGGVLTNQVAGGSIAAGAVRTDNTNVGINGQQQGIDRSGNSDNTNRNNASQDQGQSQSNVGINGQSSDNRNTLSNGSNTMTGGANTNTVAGSTQGQSSTNRNIAAQGQTSANDNRSSSANNVTGSTQGQSSTNTVAGSTQSNGSNTMTGGANTASAANAGQGAGANAGSGNQTSNVTNVDSANRSSNTYRATAWAPVIHGAAAPALAGANIVMYPGQCGPRHELVKVDVNTVHRGIIFSSEKKQGYDYSIIAATKPFVERDGYLMGHQVIEYTAVIGTSSGGSLSVGGFGSSGNGGQGGVAGSGSVQQVVQRVSLRECVYALPKAEVREIYTEVATKKIKQ